jgi:putative PIN family toxin of toxin-antitoxin system
MRKLKIIIDTNLWISLLIGKHLSELRFLCESDDIDVYICEELKSEFARIASLDKIKKYVSDERIVQTLELMNASCIFSEINVNVVSSDLRDIGDLYLLSFAETIDADFILTGDKDLLVLCSHGRTQIMTYSVFISEFFNK